MYKVLTILGNRPQFIKATLLSRKFDEHPDFGEVLVHTGQHFDDNMSGLFFDELGLKEPDYNLCIHSLERDELVEAITSKLMPILLKEHPTVVIVYGDTNSTLAGALAAKLFSVPIVHVEAGVRSFDDRMQEETNRQWVDKISRLLLAPSQLALENLDYPDYAGDVVFSGDIMKDMAIHFAESSKKPQGLNVDDFILSTIHRESNTDNIEVLIEIVKALNIINKETPVVMPIHPRTQAAIDKNSIKCDFLILPPVGYFEILYLLQNASLVVTDSGGLQKEAYYFKKPTIVVRDTSEWGELVDAGYSQLCAPVGADTILANYEDLKEKNIVFDKDFYGDGKATEIIFSSIQKLVSSFIDLLG